MKPASPKDNGPRCALFPHVIIKYELFLFVAIGWLSVRIPSLWAKHFTLCPQCPHL